MPLRHVGFLQFVPKFLGCFRVQLLVAHEPPHLRPLPRELVSLLLELFELEVYVEVVGVFYNLGFDRVTFLVQSVNILEVEERGTGKKIVRRA